MLARVAEPLRRHPLLAFFALACAITWPGWWLEVEGSQFGSLLGYFGPAIAAILVAAISSGRDGLAELVARLFRWRLRFKWYLVAVLLPTGSVLWSPSPCPSWPEMLRTMLSRACCAPSFALIVVVADPQLPRTPVQSRPASF